MIVSGKTHQGMVRRNNQDTFLTLLHEEQDSALLVVCDGMGGAKAGNIASTIAAHTFADKIETLLHATPKLSIRAIRNAVDCANEAVFQESISNPELEGMGTTLVAALIHGRHAVLINIGDSRAYRIRGDDITQLTLDHSYVQELYRKGKLTAEEARHHPNRNLITRAVGVDEFVEADIFEGELAPTDLLLLCSDGLTCMLEDGEIVSLVNASRSLDEAVEHLIAAACDNGGSDNITAVLFTGAGITKQGEAENG